MAQSQDKNSSQKKTTTSKRGFAAMPKEKVREIASKGGQAHGNSHTQKNDNQSPSKRGFAAMPKEKVKEIASKGGRSQGQSQDHNKK